MQLSVIVPVYNMAEGEKLSWCLRSLCTQEGLPDGEYEIIAVDDCSSDSSFAIMKEFESNYPGIFKAVHSPVNHHQGGAKNIGLSMAKGDWIGFIDADDWVTPTFYQRLLERADKTDADMVGCDYCLTSEHSMKVGQIVHNNTPEQTGEMNGDKYRKLLLDTGSLVVKIYKRNIIFGEVAKAGTKIFPEDIFYEDNAISNTWMLRVKHFEYIPEPLYYYYQHEESTVHTISRKNLEDRCVAGRMILQQARDNNYFDTYKPEIEFMYTVLFYVNTLFSVMPKSSKIKDAYAFSNALCMEIKSEFPDFQNNKYYQERIHPEEKKLIRMQMKSQLMFYMYYRVLWFYRDLRSKLSKG